MKDKYKFFSIAIVIFLLIIFGIFVYTNKPVSKNIEDPEIFEKM